MQRLSAPGIVEFAGATNKLVDAGVAIVEHDIVGNG